jgi:hypothetical protein
MTYVAGMSLLRLDESEKLTFPLLSSRTEGRSVHSFAHALTMCIENIRLQLSNFPDFTPTRIPLNTSALFLNHEEVENVLEAIASLCGRVSLLTFLFIQEWLTFVTLPVTRPSTIGIPSFLIATRGALV